MISYLVLIFFLLLDSAMSSFLSMSSLVLYVPCLPLCSSEFLLATDLKFARRCYLYKLDSLEITKKSLFQKIAISLEWLSIGGQVLR